MGDRRQLYPAPRIIASAGLGPILETERLILRPPAAEDFPAWAAMMQDPEVAGPVGGVMPAPMAWRAMAATIGGWTLRGFSQFSVIDKVSGAWIGRLGPWQPEGWPGKEIGWTLCRAFWGRGLASEGAGACLHWVFDHLGWDEAIHCIAAGNERSRAVAERLGARFWRQQYLPPPHDRTEVMIWGQRRDEWQG